MMEKVTELNVARLFNLSGLADLIYVYHFLLQPKIGWRPEYRGEPSVSDIPLGYSPRIFREEDI